MNTDELIEGIDTPNALVCHAQRQMLEGIRRADLAEL
jgi:hypothetical protein